MSERRHWLPDLGLGLLVLCLGLIELKLGDFGDWAVSRPYLLIILGMAVAAGLSRRAPGVALCLVWVTCGLQLLTGQQVLLVQLSIGVVAFGTARWGSHVIVAMSGLSIPASMAMAATYVGLSGFARLFEILPYESMSNVFDALGRSWPFVAAIVGLGALGLPWLAGLTLRYRVRARVSRDFQALAEQQAKRAEVERDQAEEIASLREGQAQLARDVHDVVGHSLAVILAQAESGQYLPDDQPHALKDTLATIATSARSSLQDVRQVLKAQQRATTNHASGLDNLIDGVRSSGHQVDSTEVGVSQPLPPELETVAYRVLQEMLTNAIKHGDRDQPIAVERHWPDGHWVGDLRLEVRNALPLDLFETMPIRLADQAPVSSDSGQGLDGMRRRLEAVGGRLDVRLRDEANGSTFTATAWVPVRG